MAVRVPSLFLAIVPLLAACPAPVTLDMNRLGESYVTTAADPAILQVMEASPTLRACGLASGIADRRHNVEVVDSRQFWRTAFPEPVPWSWVQTVLADPAIAQQVADLDVDYLVAVGGETIGTERTGSMTCSVQGCAGALWHQERTSLSATIWDMDGDIAIESVMANGSAKSLMAAFILPVVWLEPYTQSTTCRNLGREIASVVAERHDGDAVQVAVVGVPGSAIQETDPGRIADLIDLAADGDEAALYELAAHFQRIGDWNPIPRWPAETRFRLALAADSADRWPWLCQAAHAGHAAALAHIGWAAEADYYTDGAVETDPIEAYKWYRLALLNGEISATEDMERLQATLTPDQIAEAERRASEWRPGTCEAGTLG